MLRAAHEATRDGVLVLDADGVVISVNSRFAAIWSLPADLGIGAAVADLLVLMVVQLHEPALLDHDPTTGDVSDALLFLDGRVLERFGTTLRDAAGTRVGTAWFMRDTSNLRLAAALAGRLQAATARLAGVRTVDDVTQVVLAEGTAALGATSSGLALLEADGALHFATLDGQSLPVPDEWLVVPLDRRSLITETWHRESSLVLPDIASAEDLIARTGMAPLPADLGEQAWVTVLLRASGPRLGVLRLAWDHPHVPGELELSFVRTLADQCAQALERVGLAAQQERGATRARVRARVSDRLSASLDLDETLQTAVDLFVPELADWCVVHLLGTDGRVSLAQLHHGDADRQRHLTELFATLTISLDQPYGAGHVIRTGTIQHLPTISQEMLASVASSAEQLAALAGLEDAAGVALPLRARNRTLGAISIVRDAGGGYSDEELALAGEVATRVGLALDNARLYAEQREVAVTLQRSLLPAHLPELEGIRLGRRYLPGTSGTEVGGDLYDALPTPGGLVTLTVADVQGHGVRAAAVMGQLRAALRGYALEGHSPVGVVGRADTLMQTLEQETYATAVLAQLDPDTGAVELCGAGHPGPLLIRADGATSYVDLVPGAPLGVGGIAFGSVEIQLSPGDALLLFTDGLVEGRRQPIELGMTRLADGLRARRPAGPEELCDAALAVMGRGPDHDDDIALLALFYDGPTSQGPGSLR